MNNEILQTVWEWRHDKSHEVNGLVYEHENKIVGPAHFRIMPIPLKGKYIGFLDDLYVEPKHRGKNIGEKFIQEINKISKKTNCNVYELT